VNISQKILLVLCILTLAACGFPHDRQWIENKYTDQASKFIQVDGNRVHYRDEGEGPVVILLHGTASSLHTWDAWTQSLKKQYRVIRMDLPGFGLTGPDHNHRYEVSDDVTFLSQFLHTLNIERAHLAGSSLGGRIAWQYAMDFPEQVNSLTLMNALGYPQASWPPAIQMGQWPIMDTIMQHVSPRFMYETGLKDVYFNPDMVNDALVDRYYELSRFPGNLMSFIQRVKARLDEDGHLIKQVAVPSLILWGEEDAFFPVENAHRFKADIAGSMLVTYANVGHLPMEEVPQQSVNDFMNFIQLLPQVSDMVQQLSH